METEKQVILKVEKEAGWDLMQRSKRRMHDIHGSHLAVLQQWQESIKYTVAFISPYEVPRINMNMSICHPKY